MARGSDGAAGGAPIADMLSQAMLSRTRPAYGRLPCRAHMTRSRFRQMESPKEPCIASTGRHGCIYLFPACVYCVQKASIGNTMQEQEQEQTVRTRAGAPWEGDKR
jgi:hypothetical protein